MFKRTAPAFAAGAIFAVLIAGTGAVAATGGKFILGRSNAAGTTSTLSSGRGPALSLKAKGPVLEVGNGSKIANLNADKLDGLSSAAFALTRGKTGAFDFTGDTYDLDNNGIADAVIAYATCPAGTQMTGGGFVDQTSTGVVVLNAPDLKESWGVGELITEGSGDTGSDVTASVVCYSPTGAHLSGSYRTHPGARLPARSRIVAQMRAKLAAQE
ncbi:MAG: hypothetical protein WAV00_10665 [Nocardioides sp.]